MNNADLNRARLIIAHENVEDRGCVDDPAAVLYAAVVFRDAYDTLLEQTRKQERAKKMEQMRERVAELEQDNAYYKRLETEVRNYEKALTNFCRNPTDAGLAKYETYLKSIRTILAERTNAD